MKLLELVLTINFPILLGWIFKQTGIFKSEENATLRKFVIRVAVPFTIFKNLSAADINAIDQLIPTALAFMTITILSAILVYLVRNIASRENTKRNSFCIAAFIGNFSYLGWGVLSHFYGETGLQRGIFFTVFFWPIFLTVGFLLTAALSKAESSKKFDLKTMLTTLRKNALPPVISMILGLCVNLLHIGLPKWLVSSVASIAALTIPTILFSVGLSFSSIRKEHIRPILCGTVFRTIFSIVIGIAAVLAVSLPFDIDPDTKKAVLLESVMPSAAMSPFFVDFVDSDKEVVSGIVTFSTLCALATLPFWYFMIEKWSWLI